MQDYVAPESLAGQTALNQEPMLLLFKISMGFEGIPLFILEFT